ncbi:MAG: thymidine phosphorylase [Armatimonadetes bacterium]|nr:thymidine phosphorylase [Armatimonadota bacterium]MDE2207077.1 thymidine phosphorylase [Armatimonadota bacterium]
MNLPDFIADTREGKSLSGERIQEFVAAVTLGTVPDSQVAAWLMAVTLRGLSYADVRHLTEAMRASGRTLDLAGAFPGTTLDKHSTGGVGDKTTLVMAPVVAAAGLHMLKMSGRSLGYTGGTVDKLEAVPGLRVELGADEALSQVRHIGAAFSTQSTELAPADARMYAIRDVTATVRSIPLIAASIMSKKLAIGAGCILLDVKAGAGGLVTTRKDAVELAELMVRLGRAAGRQTAAVITPMNTPLGRAVGNALEVREALDALQDPDAADSNLRAHCGLLAALGLRLALQCSSEVAAAKVDEVWRTGAALRKMVQIAAAQGAPDNLDALLGSLPVAPYRFPVRATSSGFVRSIDASLVARIASELGAGRFRPGDRIDPAAGVLLTAGPGQRVERGDEVAVLHSSSAAHSILTARMQAAVKIGVERSSERAPRTMIIGLEGPLPPSHHRYGDRCAERTGRQ